jgi:hypothetical protein
VCYNTRRSSTWPQVTFDWHQGVMTRLLQAHQFRVRALPHPLSGRELIEAQGFDPSMCKIEVSDEGVLVVTQEGKDSRVTVGPDYWEEVWS